MMSSEIEGYRNNEPTSDNNNQMELNSKDIQTMNSLNIEEALDIIEQKTLTRFEKKSSVTKLLHRSSCAGDSETVQALLNCNLLEEFIDINAQDEEGSTPIIYAACFGYTEVVKALINSGALVNVQDKNGWPPLMWAMSNKHQDIVKILLENGASPSTRNSKGRTILDIINHGLTNTGKNEKNAKLQEILSYNHRSHKSLGSLSSHSAADLNDDNISFNSRACTDPDDLDKEFLRSCKDQLFNENSSSPNYHGYNEDSLNEYTNEEFNWDQCLPDQMFVFSNKLIPHIVGTVVTTMKASHSKEHRSVPADVLFLCSRFAFYFSTPDLLEELLKHAFKAISNCIKVNYNRSQYLAFWLANCSQLLFYFKKDPGLAESTIDYQLSLSEIIHEIYQLQVREIQAKIELELDSSILDSDSIPGLSEAHKFKDKRKGIFSFVRQDTEEEDNVSPGRSSLRKKLSLRRKPSGAQNVSRKYLSDPDNVIAILSKFIKNLKLYQVHPILISHFLNQIVYFITSELFNRILDTRNYCSRTKAMQIRMNVTILEDWIRHNSSSSFSTNLNLFFKPLLHLIQLLQCFSAHRSLSEFLETLVTLNTLSPLQIQLIAETYRYEENEEQIPEEVMQHVQSKADEVLEKKYRSVSAIKDGKSIVVVRSVDEVRERISSRLSFLNPKPNSKSNSPSRTASLISLKPLTQSPQSCITEKEIINEDSETVHSTDNTPSTISPCNEDSIAAQSEASHSSENDIMTMFQYSDFTLFRDSNHILPFVVPTQSEENVEWSLFYLDKSHDSTNRSFENLPTNPQSCYVPTIPEKFVDLLDIRNEFNSTYPKLEDWSPAMLSFSFGIYIP